MKTDCREQGSNIFVVIENVPFDQAPYKFENKTVSADFEIKELKLFIGKKEVKSYSWDDPSKVDKKLLVDVKPSSGNYQNTQFKLNIDKIGSFNKIIIKPIDIQYQPVYLKCTVSIEGYTKVIKFEMSSKSEKQIYEKRVKQKNKKYFSM